MSPFFESSRNAGVLRDDIIPSLGDYCQIRAMFFKAMAALQWRSKAVKSRQCRNYFNLKLKRSIQTTGAHSYLIKLHTFHVAATKFAISAFHLFAVFSTKL